MMYFLKVLIVFFFCQFLVSCGLIQASNIEKMADEERASWLQQLSDDRLCHGFTHPHIKPKTESQMREILWERGFTQCKDRYSRSQIKLVTPTADQRAAAEKAAAEKATLEKAAAEKAAEKAAAEKAAAEKAAEKAAAEKAVAERAAEKAAAERAALERAVAERAALERAANTTPFTGHNGISFDMKQKDLEAIGFVCGPPKKKSEGVLAECMHMDMTGVAFGYATKDYMVLIGSSKRVDFIGAHFSGHLSTANYLSLHSKIEHFFPLKDEEASVHYQGAFTSETWRSGNNATAVLNLTQGIPPITETSLSITFLSPRRKNID